MDWILSVRRWLAGRIAPPEPEAVHDEDYDPSEDPDNWLSLDFIMEQATGQLKQQWDIWNLVDGRLRLILALVGIVFAAVLGFQRGPTQLSQTVVALIHLADLCFVTAALVAAIVYIPMKFSWPPEPGLLREKYLYTDPRETKLAVIDLLSGVYTENGARIERKVNGFRIAFLLSVVAVIALALALGFHIEAQAQP